MEILGDFCRLAPNSFSRLGSVMCVATRSYYSDLSARLVARHRATVLYPPSHLAGLVGARSGDIGRLWMVNWYASRTSKSATCKLVTIHKKHVM